MNEEQPITIEPENTSKTDPSNSPKSTNKPNSYLPKRSEKLDRVMFRENEREGFSLAGDEKNKETNSGFTVDGRRGKFEELSKKAKENPQLRTKDETPKTAF